jgi:hypothetical protein
MPILIVGCSSNLYQSSTKSGIHSSDTNCMCPWACMQ